MGKNSGYKNIVLIGFSGVGKTSVGKYISKKLNMEFMDTDNLIIDSTGKTIEKIFYEYGEDYFRQLEMDTINKIYLYNNKVISTGGGIILRSKNVEKLKINGVIFYLSAEIDTIVKNLKRDKLNSNRPLLKDSKNLVERIKELYFKREKLYNNSADITIKVDRKQIEDIGNEIISIFRGISSCR